MSIVAYIDYTDVDNDATVAAIEAEENPAQVVLRIPAAFKAPDADPLETVVYMMDADTDIGDMCTAVGVTALSIDTFMEP